MTDVSGYFIFNDLVGSGTSTGGATDLSALTDTSITSPADQQVLTYLSSTGLWTNAIQTGGGGGTSDHNALANLIVGDVHTQYLFANPTSSDRNKITIQNASYRGLSIKAHVSQGVDLQSWTDSNGLIKTSVLSDGSLSGIEAKFADLSGLNSVSSVSIIGDTVNSTGNLNVTGNINVTGTVDSVNVAELQTEYDAHAASSVVHFLQSEIDHGVLLGLTDDDHTQYILDNGTRAITKLDVSGGDLNVTGNGTFTGTVKGLTEVSSTSIKADTGVFTNLSGTSNFDVTGSTTLGNLTATDINCTNLSATNNVSAAGNIQVVGTVDGVDVAARDLVLTNHVASATVHFVQGDINHEVLLNLTTGNPHTQYVLKTGGTPFTGDATFDAGINVSGSMAINGTVDGVDVAARDLVLTNHVASSVHQEFTTTTAGIVPECDTSKTYRFIDSTGEWSTPFPYSYVQMSGAGTNQSAAMNFADGLTPILNQKDTSLIEWDDTNKYFVLKETGTYEIVLAGSVLVGASPTTITMTISEVAGAVFSTKMEKVQTLRTNIDPHDINLRWIGDVTATKNYTLRVAGTNNVQFKAGSTLTCKRIG